LPRKSITEKDLELYFAVVREPFGLFGRQWPKAEFHVIVWDLHEFYSTGRARFETLKAKAHFIDDILPGYSTRYTMDSTRYVLHRFDPHPNPMAYETVASYLTERVLSTVSGKH
jgi:hypothetical protein